MIICKKIKLFLVGIFTLFLWVTGSAGLCSVHTKQKIYTDIQHLQLQESLVRQRLMLFSAGLIDDPSQLTENLKQMHLDLTELKTQLNIYKGSKGIDEHLARLRESAVLFNAAVEKLITDQNAINLLLSDLSRQYQTTLLLPSDVALGPSDNKKKRLTETIYQNLLWYLYRPNEKLKQKLGQLLDAASQEHQTSKQSTEHYQNFLTQVANIITDKNALDSQLFNISGIDMQKHRSKILNALMQLDVQEKPSIPLLQTLIYFLSTLLLTMMYFYYQGFKSAQVLRRENKKLLIANQPFNQDFSEKQHLEAYKDQQQQIVRASDEEQVVTSLLKSSFEPMEVFLRQAAKEIISQSWLGLQDMIAIYLKGEQHSSTMELICDINLNEQSEQYCSNELLKGFLCSENPDLVSNRVISQHHDGLNYYAVPILHGEALLGFMVLFPVSDDQINRVNTIFFNRIADIISIGVARKLAEQKIEYLAYHDDLTHLPNRLLLQDRLEQIIAIEQHQNNYSALIYIDLDRFKHINDSLGHSVGDAMLVEFSDRLKKILRHEDTLSCLGGNEFVVLMTDIMAKSETAIREVQVVVEKLQQVTAKAFYILGHKLFITFSAGIVMITGEELNPDTLLKQAHTAMYQAKAKGCNSISFFRPEMQAIADSRMEIEKDLRQALEKQELHVYYQPQVNENGSIIAAEALLRWKHETRGFVSPVEFIPVAEDAGLILGIGNWVLEQVCLQIKDWHHIRELKHVAVNVSPVQFRHPDFVQTFKAIMAKTSVDPNKLLFELTEGILVENVEEVIQKMSALKELGVHFSLDDFGTGYSSLSYLKRFPLDQIKIDKAFVDDIGNNENNQVLIETIIAMTERMGFSLIAEGVETHEQLDFLKQKGCQFYQGFYFNRPMPVEEFNQNY